MINGQGDENRPRARKVSFLQVEFRLTALGFLVPYLCICMYMIILCQSPKVWIGHSPAATTWELSRVVTEGERWWNAVYRST